MMVGRKLTIGLYVSGNEFGIYSGSSVILNNIIRDI